MIPLWGLLVFGCATPGPAPEPLDSMEKEAYEYNRKGMIKMSMALFDEAVVEFQKASSLLTDYEIRDRSLVYSPLFMTGWAHEKMGHETEACRFFGRFLSSSPPEWIERSKADHAESYLENCKP